MRSIASALLSPATRSSIPPVTSQRCHPWIGKLVGLDRLLAGTKWGSRNFQRHGPGQSKERPEGSKIVTKTGKFSARYQDNTKTAISGFAELGHGDKTFRIQMGSCHTYNVSRLAQYHVSCGNIRGPGKLGLDHRARLDQGLNLIVEGDRIGQSYPHLFSP